MFTSISGFCFNTLLANLLNEALASELNVAAPVPKRIPESNVTLTACKPMLSVTCSTCAPSIAAASAAALSIFLPINTPAPAPTAAPIPAPIAAPLPLPINPPMIAPAAAPPPPPIKPPFVVLFILPQPLKIMVTHNKIAINFVFLILVLF